MKGESKTLLFLFSLYALRFTLSAFRFMLYAFRFPLYALSALPSPFSLILNIKLKLHPHAKRRYIGVVEIGDPSYKVYPEHPEDI